MNATQFKQLLSSLRFLETGDVFTKHFGGDGGFDLMADFNKQELIYPQAAGFIVNERQTCNFKAPENFVVFECVHRLFEKGYAPKHIELEPRWQLGRGASGGRADIWVKDNNKKSLLIIECKTAGKEFKTEWRKMQESGGQLFSYFQQERETEFLALYTSDFTNGILDFEYNLISVKDHKAYLSTKDNPLTYEAAGSVKELYRVWSETYLYDFTTKGLFEKDIAPYTIGKLKYSADDLVPITEDKKQKKYNDFAEILRKSNISGHENAFDKLVNLFLAKIVDEQHNKDELKFYWKGAAYDDEKSLLDRLQELYRDGMKEFLGEDVTVVKKEDIEKAFRFLKQRPDATKNAILEFFDELKYYSNNDFAFIDVHNKTLFLQNSVVLREIVLMLQDIKLQTEKEDQFLGDLFEGFLDDGIKQSEGQYFTPMPIVKFIISSFPLRKIILESDKPPRMIDYACGAGHFLNEYAREIEPFVKEKAGNKFPGGKLNKSYYKAITGIEKEYRLSKVAKVSAFMYRQDEISIVYTDALASHKKIKDGSFHVLASNPPFSVKGFLETLNEKARDQFELTQSVNDINKNDAIETFFVERAKQLLAEGGIAAIVLPSSVLSNGGIHEKMREILLQFFDIIAVAELGGGTFGKTGTNTATFFMRRKDEKPSISDQYKNRVDVWFAGDFEIDDFYEDAALLRSYCEHIKIPFDDYKTMFVKNPPLALNDNLSSAEIIKEYRAAFEKSADAKKIAAKNISDKYTEENKKEEYKSAWFYYLQAIEKEKLYFYMLAKSNPQPVTVVKSPSDSKALKEFLGYGWSERRGNEGIKYLHGTTINQIKTPLFNPLDLQDGGKINALIRAAFEGNPPEIPEALKAFVSIVRLEDMLDFSRVTFDKAFKTTPEKQVEIKSKYPLVKLDSVAIVEYGDRIVKKETVGDEYPVYGGGGETFRTNNFNRENRYIISRFGMSPNCVRFVEGRFFLNDSGMTLTSNSKDLLQSYLDNYICAIQNTIYVLGRGSAQKNMDMDAFRNFSIPLPPLSVQQQIVAECEKVDEEYNTSRMGIEQYRQKIAQVFENLEVILRGGGGNYLKISDIGEIKMCKRIFKEQTSSSGDIPFYKIGTFGKEADAYISMELYNEYKNKYSFPKNGDVLISAAGTVGKTVVYDGKPAYYQDSNIVWVDNDETKVTNKFLYYSFQNVHWENEQTDGGIISRLYNDNLRNIQIPVPPLAEQRRIVQEVEGYEAEIAKLQAVMDGAGERKKRILEKWLNG